MRRKLLAIASTLLGLWVALSLFAGWVVLPGVLLRAPLPVRTDIERESLRASLLPRGCRWASSSVRGGEGRTLEVWHLCRPESKGVAILLHGFGDDAWGPAPRLRDLPNWDIVVFTFRGRDLDQTTPSTLGGWEAEDVVSVVQDLEKKGFARRRLLLVGASQGAGVALLALNKLERIGQPLGGALLESPFETLKEAAKNHVRGTLGWGELLLRPAENLALARAGHLAHFRPNDVSPLAASVNLKTPIALLAGDSDRITPLSGVMAIGRYHPDLTIVHGADHLEAAVKLPGGWVPWANARLTRFGF